jgi:hypothetical protein
METKRLSDVAVEAALSMARKSTALARTPP